MPPRVGAFALRGRTEVTRLRCRYTRSYALSRTFNTRNLEYYWYPTWNQSLYELIGDEPQLFVFPQYPLWFSSALVTDPEGPADISGDEAFEDEVEGSSEDGRFLGTGVESLPAVETDTSAKSRVEEWQRQQASEEDKWAVDLPYLFQGGDRDDDDELDATHIHNITLSSAATVPRPKAILRLADYAIVHVTVDEDPQLPARYEGYRIVEERVPIIVEEKRYVDRSLEGDEHDVDLFYRLDEAKVALDIQAALLFRTHHSATVVTAIAAAGPFWSTAEFEPVLNHGVSARKFEQGMRDEKYHIVLSTVRRRTDWSDAVKLDTPTSIEQFGTLQAMLGRL